MNARVSHIIFVFELSSQSSFPVRVLVSVRRYRTPPYTSSAASDEEGHYPQRYQNTEHRVPKGGQNYRQKQHETHGPTKGQKAVFSRFVEHGRERDRQDDHEFGVVRELELDAVREMEETHTITTVDAAFFTVARDKKIRDAFGETATQEGRVDLLRRKNHRVDTRVRLTPSSLSSFSHK